VEFAVCGKVVSDSVSIDVQGTKAGMEEGLLSTSFFVYVSVDL